MASQVPANQQPLENDPSQQEQQEESTETQGLSRFLMFTAVPSWMVSMIVHSIMIIILMFLNFPPVERTFVEVDSSPEKEQEIEEIEELKIEELEIPEFEDTEPTEFTETVEVLTEFEDVPLDSSLLANDTFAMEFDQFSEQEAPTAEIAAAMGSVAGTGTEGRTNAATKADMIRKAGGNSASEAAVAKALKWIARHQLEDGGWSFDHTLGPGNFRNSRNPGDMPNARNAATAMALLPFLGAGQTHLEGEYKPVVEGGLNFLIRNQKAKSGGGSFEEGGGNMYSHGLASIVICEALSMTKDSRLIVPAQASLNYISYAQDPVGGGWRYQARQPGDTSVVGWQLMALKSGSMAYLDVPGPVIKKSVMYLDTVSDGNGAYYGYAGPGRGTSTTAIGLLCRMYLGWEQDHPSLKDGIKYLADTGPSLGNDANMYYDYYATQVMRHNGGDYWEKWNKEMRDFLIKEQADKGNETGSWHFDHNWGKHGGRLYNTSMATMILEVYYRHLPIYKSKAAEEEFKLD
jgi:hypothetical protein